MAVSTKMIKEIKTNTKQRKIEERNTNRQKERSAKTKKPETGDTTGVSGTSLDKAHINDGILDHSVYLYTLFPVFLITLEKNLFTSTQKV